MNRTDDTVARYDLLEALEEIAATTGIDLDLVARVLEGEIDYLGCLGVLDDQGLDDASRRELDALREENADLFALSDGEYDPDVAVAFIQRNRGVDKDTITGVLEANYRFMDRRGLLDEGWDPEWSPPRSRS